MEHSETFLPRTEKPNSATKGIDTWPIERMLEIMNQEDAKIAPAVSKELPKIKEAVDLVIQGLSKGGRLFYAGAGTSGRLGVLDASEIQPTFGIPKERIIPLISGGKEAVFYAIEGAEDSQEHGESMFLSHCPRENDVVIGIAASGRTPFVAGILKSASLKGIPTVAIVGDPQGAVGQLADVVISPDVGPEIITGSTRLKNGTAQKLVLNMISTATMIALGRTYSNWMAGTYLGNQKLSSRAKRILSEAAQCSLKQAQDALEKAKGNLPAALVMLLSNTDVEGARTALRAANGAIRNAVDSSLKKKQAVLKGFDSTMDTESKTSDLCFGAPENAGFDAQRLERAFDVVQEAVGDGEGLIPGAVATVVRNGIVIEPRAYGWACRTPQRIKMTPETIFDMASLTKVTATTPSIMMLIEQGLIRLDDPVSLFVPEFGTGGKQNIAIRHLMSHTSGLPGHIRYWKQGITGRKIIDSICDLELRVGLRPGAHVEYSDLGFIILGEIVKRVTGLNIKEFSEQKIFGPLGMSSTCYLPSETLKPKIAATEYREDFGKVIWGQVHDENCHSLGGIAGHAGLFSTSSDMVKYALMWLGEGTLGETRILGRKTVEAAIKERADLEERRALGWQLRGRAFSSGGDLMSDRAYGHTGFTGTSLWCDPEENLGVILLTNRVHAGREGNAHIRLRPRFANAVCAAIK